MKSNIKNRLRQQEEQQYDGKAEGLKRLGILAASVALHREFGFGSVRLRRFIEAVRQVYSEFDARSTACDAYTDGKKRANSDTALVQLLAELRSCGIDHREIFNDGREIGVVDEYGKRVSADECLDRLGRKNV